MAADRRELLVGQRAGLARIASAPRACRCRAAGRRARGRACGRARGRARRRSPRRAPRRGACAPRSSVRSSSRTMSARTRGPEERLLGGDQLGRGEVADDGVRRRRAVQVQRDRHADERDAEQLERVADPPRERAGPEQERRNEREAEPGHADDDHEVRGAARQRDRSARRAGRPRATKEPAPTTRKPTAGAARPVGSFGTTRGWRTPTSAERQHGRGTRRLATTGVRTLSVRRSDGSAASASIAPPTGSESRRPGR